MLRLRARFRHSAAGRANIRGTYLLTRAMSPLILKGGDKKIVLLTSIGAFMPAPGGSGYQISKLALLRYAEYLNIVYGVQDVVAYGLHPGAVLTNIGLTMPAFLHHKLIDKAELAADTIVFLVSVVAREVRLVHVEHGGILRE